MSLRCRKNVMKFILSGIVGFLVLYAGGKLASIRGNGRCNDTVLAFEPCARPKRFLPFKGGFRHCGTSRNFASFLEKGLLNIVS